MTKAAPRHDGTALPGGRPLRFLAAVLMLWIGGRAMALLGPDLGGANDGGASVRAAAARLSSLSGANIRAMTAPAPRREARYSGTIAHLAPPAPSSRLDRIPIIRTHGALPGEVGARPSGLTVAIIPVPVAAVAMAAASAAPSFPVSIAPPPGPGVQARRWSGAAWLLWRDKNGARAIGSAGQLGGAQAGLRIDRHIAGSRAPVPVSVYARLTAALRAPAAPEAALGIALHPVSGRVPVMIGVERRVALDRNGRDAFSILAATGLNPVRIAGGPLIAEGYAQAGMVGLSRRDLFADGRITLTVPLDEEGGTGVGLGLSGGAQPGLSRLDAGPVFQTRLPLGRVKPRLSVEWRHRIAGNATPGSGPAVTLASDF